jgi:proteasome lid subunit RPN8/RPN11
MATRFKIVFRSKAGQTRTEETTIRPLFDEFILRHVSTLVARGLIYERELYHSHVTPRYDDAPDYEREVVYFETPERPWLEAGMRPGWLSEPQLRGEPLRYFTLTLYTTPRRLVYRRDFPLAVLDTVISRRIEQLDTEVSTQREWDWEIVALSQETDPLFDYPLHSQTADASALVVLVEPVPPLAGEVISLTDEPLEISVEDMHVDLPAKSLPSGPYEVHGTKTIGDLNILISRDTLQKIEQEAAERMNFEGGGLLIGEAFKEETSKELVVYITAYIPAKGAEGTMASVRFTSKVWNTMLHIREREYPNAQVVGWYHDHIIGAWMSADDRFIHENIFKEPWQVAFILGKRDGIRRFFQWKGGQIVPSNWFQIVG